MTLSARPYADCDRAAWDAFVEAHALGTPFHLTAWKRAMEATFGFRSVYLTAEEDGRLRGVLPLFLIRNIIQGRVLLSSPFAVYGGILADGPEALAALAEAAMRLGEKERVQHIELRNADPAQCVGWERIHRYAGFKQALQPEDGEALLANLPKKTRNMIRKALKSAYAARPAASLDAFERLMLENYRRHGTPAFPRRHFENLRREFGARVDVREILLDGQVAAASMNFLFRGEMHTYYAASDAALLAFAPNNYLYYDHLLWAGQNGYQWFDFGRSKYGTGPYEFKQHWRAREMELPYEIRLVRRAALPDFTPKNAKFGAAIAVWRRMPLWLTRWAGPFLVRLFP